MIRKYHNHKPQKTPRHGEEEPPNHHETPGRQTKQSNQPLPLPTKMIATLEWTQSNVQQNIEQSQTPTIGVTIHKKSTKPVSHIHKTFIRFSIVQLCAVLSQTVTSSSIETT